MPDPWKVLRIFEDREEENEAQGVCMQSKKASADQSCNASPRSEKSGLTLQCYEKKPTPWELASSPSFPLFGYFCCIKPARVSAELLCALRVAFYRRLRNLSTRLFPMIMIEGGLLLDNAVFFFDVSIAHSPYQILQDSAPFPFSSFRRSINNVDLHIHTYNLMKEFLSECAHIGT